MINSIRGIVEIEQAELEAEKVESDKSLERTIQLYGMALGISAIASGSIYTHIDKPITVDIKRPPHLIVSSIFWSTVVTLFLFLLTWFLTKKKNNSK
ncbi:MAG: hypothetical protein HC908_11065 [Calothrix sp. SM1_7_51]|nr:hypothetical protein [Calothrix sp. SM1_7_51]